MAPAEVSESTAGKRGVNAFRHKVAARTRLRHYPPPATGRNLDRTTRHAFEATGLRVLCAGVNRGPDAWR